MNDLVSITELVTKYFTEGKDFDKSFFEGVISIVTNSDGTSDYINNFYVIDSSNREDPSLKKYCTGFHSLIASGFYDAEEKNLVLYPTNMKYDAHMEAERLHFENEEESYMFKNLLMLQTLLHELEHVKQHKMLDAGSNDLESNLLRAINSIKTPITISSYVYDPTERLAQIRSYTKMKEIVSLLPFDLDKTKSYFSTNLKAELTHGYDEDISATEKFFSILDATEKLDTVLEEHKLSNIKFSVGDIFKSLSSQYRLRRDSRIVELGLPISKNRLNRVIESRI